VPKKTDKLSPQSSRTLDDVSPTAGSVANETQKDAVAPAREIGGPKGPDPTRFGDWEKAGRCIDF
jgi:hypothetical protein